VEFIFIIGDEGLHPVTKAVEFQSFRNFVPKHAFTRYCWGNTEFLWKTTMVRRRRARRAFTPHAGRSS
jgi:hypothetical protein